MREAGLSADQACQKLGVARSTMYCLLGSRPDQGGAGVTQTLSTLGEKQAICTAESRELVHICFPYGAYIELSEKARTDSRSTQDS